jgi:hypothetical protein
VTVGNILGEAWTLYTRFFTRFFVLALVVFLITGLASAIVASLVDRGSTFGGFLLGIVAIAVILVGTYWVQGALVFAVKDARDGAVTASNEEILRKVRPFLGILIVAGIIAGFGVAIGLVLLIVPGLVLLTWWALVVPVIVLEGRRVVASFGRSRALVRGHGWTVFGVVIIAAILSTIVSNAISIMLSFLPDFLDQWLGSAVAGAVVAPFMATAVTLMYLKLAEAERQPPPPPLDELASSPPPA